MTSTLSAATLMTQVPLELGYSTAHIALPTKRLRTRSDTNLCKSAVLRVALVLSGIILFGARLSRMWTVAHL